MGNNYELEHALLEVLDIDNWQDTSQIKEALERRQLYGRDRLEKILLTQGHIAITLHQMGRGNLVEKAERNERVSVFRSTTTVYRLTQKGYIEKIERARLATKTYGGAYASA